jgi:hypothetical protein
MGVPPVFLWYRIGKTSAEMTSEERSNIVTELDVLYGDDIPWYGFEKLEPATMLHRKQQESTWLTMRRGVKRTSIIFLLGYFLSFQLKCSTTSSTTPPLLARRTLQDRTYSSRRHRLEP